ncbi:ABC transporter substrate-binding protein [Lentzea sp. JNUCC 0626]|uniref:ABC transporter substrate-binding protein n=1 Tax=Lentzea sp. JNUCC 0626 TaxID=3367513 RepID=UPI003748C2D7
MTAGCAPSSPTDEGHRLRVVLPSPEQPERDGPRALTRLGVAETLTRLDQNQQAQPLLALDWVKQLDRQWRIRLRENVMFHDGLRFTADAVALALNHAARSNPPLPALRNVNITASAISTNELLITTDRPDPAFLERLSSASLAILSPAFYRGGGAKAAGTGPFKVVGERPGDRLRLDAFSSYWNEKPALSGVDVRFLPVGTARMAALRQGDADVATDLPISELRGDGLQEVPLPRTTSLYLNTAKAPFSNAALRAVVSGAVDREKLVRAIYQGHADVARTMRRHDVTAPVPPQGSGAGQTILLAGPSDRPELVDTALSVAESLRAKGFLVEQVVKPYRELEPDLLAGKFDAAVLSRSYLPETGDPVAYFASDFKCSGGYNFTRLCDPAVDSAISKATGAPDRALAADGVESVVLASGAIIPLVHERGFFGHSDRVTGLGADPLERELITSSTGRK